MKNLLLNAGLILTLITFGFSSSSAQDYKLAVGARLGVPLSASVKTKIGEGKMIEGTLGFRNYTYTNWISVSGNYQKYTSFEEVLDGLYWYYGGGVSAYFWTYDDSFFGPNEYGSTTFGFQGNVGLDYKFENKPINISLDYMPTYFFGGYIGGFGGGYGALAIRYTIGD